MKPINLNIKPIRQDPLEISTRKAADFVEEFRKWNDKYVNDVYQLEPITEMHFVGKFLPKGIKVIFQNEKKKPVIFPFSTYVDGFRVLYDPFYLNACKFELYEDKKNGDVYKIYPPDINLLQSFEWKSVKYADDFIQTFSPLNETSVAELEGEFLATEYEYYNEEFVYGILFKFEKYGEVVFKYGPSINIGRMKTDPEYVYSCSFFMPDDTSIRFVNRYNFKVVQSSSLVM